MFCYYGCVCIVVRLLFMSYSVMVSDVCWVSSVIECGLFLGSESGLVYY